MKEIICSLLSVVTAVCAVYDEELPEVSPDSYELKTFMAMAGDMNVALSWEAYPDARPDEYPISWTSGSLRAEGGQMTVETEAPGIAVSDLANDVAYTFSIQSRYTGGLASKRSTSCMPKNAGYPVTSLTASAGDKKARLRWTKPASEWFTNCQITVSPSNQVIKLGDTTLEEYMVEGLTNDQEYKSDVVCIYPMGNSVSAEAVATPGIIYPVAVNTELVAWESAVFAYNDMYFTGGNVKSISWGFGDGTASAETTPSHAFVATGTYTATITVTYTNNTTESGSVEINVVKRKRGNPSLNFNGSTGCVKTSNPIFSPGRKTMYIPTSAPAGHSFALDAVSGELK